MCGNLSAARAASIAEKLEAQVDRDGWNETDRLCDQMGMAITELSASCNQLLESRVHKTVQVPAEGRTIES